jgi:hypothetical protein
VRLIYWQRGWRDEKRNSIAKNAKKKWRRKGWTLRNFEVEVGKLLNQSHRLNWIGWRI